MYELGFLSIVVGTVMVLLGVISLKEKRLAGK